MMARTLAVGEHPVELGEPIAVRPGEIAVLLADGRADADLEARAFEQARARLDRRDLHRRRRRGDRDQVAQSQRRRLPHASPPENDPDCRISAPPL